MNRRMRWLTTLALWLLVAVAHAGTVTYVYTDPQGTPLAEANASGTITATYDYTPYGSPVAGMSGSPNGPGYTGHVNDPDTGLVYMQARYYDPAMGRFLSVDPAGMGAGNAFSFNRFAYVNNNPIMHVDPTGMVCGGNGEVSAKTQAMRDTSDGCNGSMAEHAEANSSSRGSLQQSSSIIVVASPSEYTRNVPQGISGIAQSPLVQAWEKEVRNSHDFNARPPAERKEHGAWLYEDDSGGFTLISMPDARRNPTLGSFSEIAAGDPPVVDGFHPVFNMHSHPFATVNSLSKSQGFLVMGYPQPSQNDIEYSKAHNNLPGMVVSHDGDFFYGTGGQ